MRYPVWLYVAISWLHTFLVFGLVASVSNYTFTLYLYQQPAFYESLYSGESGQADFVSQCEDINCSFNQTVSIMK